MSARYLNRNRTVIWFKDGVEIKHDKRIKSSSEGTVHTLTIRKTEGKDAGEYTAKIGEEVTKAKLVVEEAVANFTSPLTDGSVVAGETAVLSCDVSKPNCKVSWYKNGTEIKPSDTVQLETNGTTQTLTIRNVNTMDAGDYTCRLGDEETKAKLTVLGKLRKRKNKSVALPKNDDIENRYRILCNTLQQKPWNICFKF